MQNYTFRLNPGHSLHNSIEMLIGEGRSKRGMDGVGAVLHEAPPMGADLSLLWILDRKTQPFHSLHE